MIRDLVDKNSTVLNSVASRYDFGDEENDPIQLAKDLAETMISNSGLGLAAPQIGVSSRVFAITGNPILVCFNPILVDVSNEEIVLEEGCLSHPNMFVKVKRPKKVKIRFSLPNGEVETRVFDGMTARIVQHELDHLDGVCHLKKASKFHLEQAMRRKKKLDRRT